MLSTNLLRPYEVQAEMLEPLSLELALKLSPTLERFAMKLRHRLTCAASIVALFSVCSNAFAADERADSESNPTEVIVLGQKNTPITVEPRGLSVSLSQEQFEGINALNVEDLMKYTPNFFVRKRFAGDDNAVVALRGANTIQSARTIVMVDGFVVSNFLGNRYDYPPKWNVVGPTEVRQFDIVYGPFSARYGGNSMGGVVSVTTRNPKKNEQYATAQAMIMPFKEYGFDETFYGYSLEAGLTYRPDKSPWSFRASYRHFDNVGQSMSYTNLKETTGSGTNVTGAYADPAQATPVFGAASPVHVTQDQVRFRVGYEMDNGWQADFIAFGWRTNQDLTNARTWIKDSSGNPITTNIKVAFNGKAYSVTSPTYSLSDRDEFLAGAKVSGPLGDGWTMSSNLSHYWIPKNESLSSTTLATGIGRGAGTSTIQKTPGWWTWDTEFERSTENQNFALGLNANLYHTDQDQFSTTNWFTQAGAVKTASFFGKTSLIGVYAEDEMLFDWGTLTFGIRADSWHAFDGGIGKKNASTSAYYLTRYPERKETSVSPKLSFQTKTFFEADLQVSMGTATRFPTVGELFQGKIIDSTGDLDPQSFDPNLKPEFSKDLNVIVRKKINNVNYVASYFYQDITDAVFSYPVFIGSTTVTRYENIDLVRQYGLELVGEAKDVFVKGLDIDASITRIEAKTIKNIANPTSEGIKFPRIPDWRISGNVRYKITPTVKASLGWRYASRPNSDLFGLSRGDSWGFQSEYMLFDTRVSWDITPKTQVSLGVDNINNDQAYVAHPLPQRTFLIELKYKN